MTEHRFYPKFEGQLTAPDVAKLIKAFPDLKIGDRISHDQISQIIGEKWRSPRYSTVTSAWRRALFKDRELTIKCSVGWGFFVANFEQVAADTHPMLIAIGRKANRQGRRVSVFEVETEQQKAEQAHNMILCHNMDREAKKNRMNFLPSTVQAQPQISPPAANATLPSAAP